MQPTVMQIFCMICFITIVLSILVHIFDKYAKPILQALTFITILGIIIFGASGGYYLFKYLWSLL